MKSNIEREACLICSFRIGMDMFDHFIFPQERDQVELQNEQGETVLEFSNDLIVRNKDGIVGNITREGDEWVYYENPLRTRVVCPSGMSLLTFEREISKRYLMAQRQSEMVESEGGLTD